VGEEPNHANARKPDPLLFIQYSLMTTYKLPWSPPVKFLLGAERTG
jgi:hypothetical protein